MITWFQGDCFELLATDDEKSENAVEALSAIVGEYGVIFASPPWGGQSNGIWSRINRLIENQVQATSPKKSSIST